MSVYYTIDINIKRIQNRKFKDLELYFPIIKIQLQYPIFTTKHLIYLFSNSITKIANITIIKLKIQNN